MNHHSRTVIALALTLISPWVLSASLPQIDTDHDIVIAAGQSVSPLQAGEKLYLSVPASEIDSHGNISTKLTKLLNVLFQGGFFMDASNNQALLAYGKLSAGTGVSNAAIVLTPVANAPFPQLAPLDSSGARVSANDSTGQIQYGTPIHRSGSNSGNGADSNSNGGNTNGGSSNGSWTLSFDPHSVNGHVAAVQDGNGIVTGINGLIQQLPDVTSGPANATPDNTPSVVVVHAAGYVSGGAYGNSNVSSNIIHGSSADAISYPLAVVNQALEIPSSVTINSAADIYNYALQNPENGSAGHDPATGIYWVYAPAQSNAATGDHFLFGPALSNMPTSGTASYVYAGGTQPTLTVAGNNAYGSSTGASFTASNLVANFSAQTLTNTNAMVMSFPATSSTPAASFTIAAGQTFAYGSSANINVSCSGACTGMAGGVINSRFTGNGASGLGVAINTWGSNGVAPVANGQPVVNMSASVVAAYRKQ